MLLSATLCFVVWITDCGEHDISDIEETTRLTILNIGLCSSLFDFKTFLLLNLQATGCPNLGRETKPLCHGHIFREYAYVWYNGLSIKEYILYNL